MNPRLEAWLVGPVKSWVVSQLYSAWSIFVFAASLALTQGLLHGWQSFFDWLLTISFPFFLALVLGIGPYARAVQGANRLQNTVTLDDGRTAIIVSPPAPAPNPPAQPDPHTPPPSGGKE
jgi:hypothetical protein